MKKIGLLIVSFFMVWNLSAQEIEKTGKASFIDNTCDKMADKDRKETVNQAKKKAWLSYTAGFSQSKMKEYKKIEQEILDKLDDYLIETTVVDSVSNKAGNSCDILVRIKINETAVNAKLNVSSAIGQVDSGEGSTISFIFVGRQVTSIKSFDAKNVSIASVEETKNTLKTTTGGSVEKKSAKEKYEIIATTDFDSSFNKVLTENGFESTDYNDVFSECGGASSASIKAEFAKNDELSAANRKKAIDAAKKCEVKYFALGYMNVSVPDKDPVTGNEIVIVSINGMVWDIAKKLPKKIGSVGPVQYSGLGSDQNTARRNALNKAAAEAAKDIVAQLNSKSIK